MDTSAPFVLFEGNLVCSVPGCNASLTFKVNETLKHFRDGHKEVFVTQAMISSRLTSLGLGLLVKAKNIIHCQSCQCQVPNASIGSVRKHLREIHGIRIKSDVEIQSFLQQEEGVPISSTSDSVGRVVLSQYCPHPECTFAISLEENEKITALKILLSHVTKKHGAHEFDDTASLTERVRCSETGEATFIGKRLKKSPSSTTSSTDTTQPNATTLEGPTDSQTSSTSTIMVPYSSTSSPSQPSSQITSRTTTMHSQPLGQSHPYRDDFFLAVLTGKRVPFICRAEINVPNGLMLSDAAISAANSSTDIYMKLNWWVSKTWYVTMCTEGALHWFKLVSETKEVFASDATLFEASLSLINYGVLCAERGQMFHPGMAGGLSNPSASMFNEEEQDAIMAAVGPRYSMTNLLEQTRERYAKELVRILHFINNITYQKTNQPMFGSDWNENSSEINGGTLAQILIQIEWPEGLMTCRMGVFAQAVAASALMDGRTPSAISLDENSIQQSPVLEDLRLVPGSRLAATCSAIMYVIKCLVVINRMEERPFASVKRVFFDSSRSGPQLAALKSDYDHSPSTHKAFEDLFSYDVAESTNRGQTPVVRVSPTKGGQGVHFLGKKEISAAVTQATASSFDHVRQILIKIGLSDTFIQLLSIAHRNIKFMPMQDIIGHFVSHGISEQALSEISALDLGALVTEKVRVFLEENPDERARFIERLKELQDLIIFLVHIVSGGPGRAQDVLDIMLVYTPTNGHISALTEMTMRIEALVHKTPDVQHTSARTISRFPNYSTAKLISIFVAFSQGVFPNHQRLWLPSVRNDSELTKCFERAANQCFRVPIHFNWWRHIIQILVARGHQELEDIHDRMAIPGSRTAFQIEEEDSSSSANPSMSNLLTKQHGHSLATAARNYGTKMVSSCDWQMASLTYQNWLHIDDTTCLEDSVGSISTDRFIATLFPENVNNSAQRCEFITEMIGKVYPSSSGFRSDIQINFLEAILLGASDVVVTGGCGTGKSAAYLVPGMAIRLENSGRCVLLLCPQNNVALSACDLCEKAGLRHHLFENNQATKEFVQTLCDTDGLSMSVPVIIATFQYISDSSMFADFVNVMTKTHRLARVIVDEVHICLSSYSWRSCFNNCGNLRARLGYSVPWAFTTATLPVAALEPYLRFWHCGLRPTSIIRAPMKMAENVMFTVEPYANTSSVFKGLKTILKELFGSRRWVTRRCLVLTLSIESANKLAGQLNALKQDLNLEQEDIIKAITSENTAAETRDAINNAKIIVCTTVISTSMNIPSMDAVIVFKSCYSLADLVQAWGRAGREGQYSRCYLLWCKSSHNIMFPKESLDAELSSVGWLRPQERTAEIHKAFSPSGVLAFSEEKGTCRRIQIFKAFDGESDDLPRQCVDLDNAGGPELLCDCCRLTLTEGYDGDLNSSNFGDSPTVHRGDDDDKGAGDDERKDADQEEEEDEHSTPPDGCRESSSEAVMSEAIRRQYTNDEMEETGYEDDDFVNVPMLDRVHDPASPHVIDLFRGMANILDEREGSGLLDACFMCNSKTCNGIKDTSTAKGFVCPGRRVLSEATWNFICFGCGGHHDGKGCKYRKPGTNPEVPSGIERCYTCFLPQKAQYGSSFHAGDAGMSGKSNHCRQRGKALFGLLSASAHLKREALHVYRQQASSQINQPPIQVKEADDGQGFGLFWDWLWERNSLAHGVYNMDVWISFLLKLLKDSRL